MLKKFHSMYRENADPFILRVVIAGERSENAAHSLGVLMSELVDAAMESSENPLCENNDSPMKPSGVLIDYENVFIELIEGYERHIVQYLKLLHNHCEHKESAHCSNVQVLFLTDDVPTPTTPFFGFVDKVPAITEDGGIQEKTDEEFAEMIVADVHRLMELASLAANEPTNKRKMFLDNVRVTRPLLFPLTSSIRSYLAKDFCFTLGEYVKVFGSIPVLTRDVELNHPAEDPLKY
ncbi:hypothetical protein DQ04_04251010 [Trypanosoma grayi]|uniref:hypothetical protein n=1 Tax=Trypanosoma grayi TaxID=71804 RepID=UPI0004F41A9C|nr:hypothetical protein DQ04_04251010 [Trypanosoma grayi]KEG10046.1 hypothetical protein DQ04_04251010 [Trypanosoma grayi]